MSDDDCRCHQTFRADCPNVRHRAHAGELTPWAYRTGELHEVDKAEPPKSPAKKRGHLRVVWNKDSETGA